MIGPLIKLLRPKQWAKNILVFAAPIFAAKITEQQGLTHALIAFVAMSLMSSATYIFNDIADVKRDREHPKKKNRPIASGAVPVPLAIIFGLLIGGAALGLAYSLNRSSLILLLVYAAMQVAYNLFLKKIPIADVFTIAVGFILRAMLGATAVWVPISGWLLFCTGALALMLGFAKRRNEFILQGDSRTSSRESLAGYSQGALDALVIMTATGAAICYGIYTVDSGTARSYPALIVTSLFVFYGIARYVLIAFKENEGGEPADLLFGDRHILTSVVLFLVSAMLAVSGVRIPLLEK
jgi:4-hydroxybenzoate polyprenyltransferase